jgi:hypothetical protein
MGARQPRPGRYPTSQDYCQCRNHHVRGGHTGEDGMGNTTPHVVIEWE